MINIDDPAKPETLFPLWRLGFRPFFLGGAAFSAIVVPIWLMLWYHPGALPLMSSAFWTPVIPLWWHPHEMLFGFVMAIVSGYLLTAVQNWTHQTGMKGPMLAVTFACWLGARLLLLSPTAIPLWLPALLDALFLLSVSVKLFQCVVKVRQWRNIAFPILLLVATGANLTSYYALYNKDLVLANSLWQGMIWWIILLITFMGGRIIPFFTAIRLKIDKPQPIKWLDLTLFGLLILLAVNAASRELLGSLALPLLALTGVLQLVRQARWNAHLTLKEPLLWSLHLSYFCIPLALLGMAWFDGNPQIERQLTHLLAVGAIGGVILSMICRVSLGHTGRNVYQGPSMAPAFLLVAVAALLRAVVPILWPNQIVLWHWGAALAWTAAFGYFVIRFAPLLLRPRVDGRPG